MEKTLIIAAFPQDFLKICVFDGAPNTVNVAPMLHTERLAAPRLIEQVDKAMNKYANVTTIGLLGPAAYTQKLLTDLQFYFKDNNKLTIQMMGA